MGDTPICQYWIEEEPNVCSYWDEANTICKYGDLDPSSPGVGARVGGFTYYGNDPPRASYYPYCNLIGTQVKCNKYDSSDVVSGRCILPDPYRHACNIKTAQKWVTRSTTYSDGSPVYTWSFDDISGYNEGLCDSIDATGGGTDVTCSGYTPHNMSFGPVAPAETTSEDISFSDTCVFGGYRLPLEHVILNKRAKLSACNWWDGAPEEFTTGKNTDFESACSYTPFETVEDYATGSGSYGFKCNGASSECPQYTGICWRYCIDPKLDPGDKVLAEQIQELRYYSRRKKWTKESFEALFPEGGNIYAWTGQLETISNTQNGEEKTEYRIPVTNVYMDDFSSFEIKYKDFVATEGIPVKGGPPTYPSLIREIDDLPIEPLIMNVFEYDDRTGLHYFETNKLFEEDDWWFYGYAPPGNSTFLVNLEDPEILKILPVTILKSYNTMYDIKVSLGDDAFNDFHDRLDKALIALEVLAPEKLRLDTNGNNKSMFIVNVPTFMGYNTVAVFNKNDGVWTYDKVIFEKAFIGGIITQTSFEVKGDDKCTVYLPDYAASFGFTGQAEKTGQPKNAQTGYQMGGVGFSFGAIANSSYTPELSYLYNDYSFKELNKIASESLEIAVDKNTGDKYVLEDNSHYSTWKAYHYTGYALYVKEIEEITISGSNVVSLDSGHMVVTITDDDPEIAETLNEINNAVMPWTFLISPKLMRPPQTEEEASEFPDGVEICELDVVIHSSEGGLLPQQILLYPADVSKYNGYCGQGYYVYFERIYIFQKRSFTEEPPQDSGYYMIPEFEDQRVYTDEVLITNSNNIFTLKLFHSPLVMSAVFKNRTGRDFGQTKTKLVTWVKQPMCPDVEIKYEWKNDYTIFRNSPACYCHGEWIPIKIPPEERVWALNFKAEKTEERVPYCGDHDIIDYSTQWALWNGNPDSGAMWYPYNKCEGYQTYEIITGGVETAVEIMSEFTIKQDGEYIHGQHDLRMLGPDVHMAWEEGWCVAPSWCSCGMPTWNKRQNRPENNTFSGYAYVRAGVSNFQLNIWEQLLEDTPRFGNSPRSAMRSYRAMDQIQFYYNRKGAHPRTRQWLPAPMYFTDLNITKSAPNEALAHYSSGYGNVIEGLGLMAFDIIDGVYINETIDYENRFRFEQVFRCNGFKTTKTPIAYPDFVGSYNRNSTPWYEYLPYPNNTNHTIHWAWRDIWRPINRRSNITLSETVDRISENYDILGPYVEDIGLGELTGFLFPFVLSYPDYVYDKVNKEIRLVCDEGSHMLRFIAPTRDEHTGEYTTDAALQLDNGPYKYFSVMKGDWVRDSGDIYDTTKESPWINTVNLYTEDSDFSSVEDRTFEVESGVDYYYNILFQERYFNRGLFVTLIAAGFKFLPAKLFFIKPGEYNAWIYPDQFNRDSDTDELYVSGESDLAITFEFDNKLKSVMRLDLTCKFGFLETKKPVKEKGETNEDYQDRLDKTDSRHNLYHWPAFDVYYKYVQAPIGDQAQLDDAPWVLIHQEDTMLLANKNSQTAAYKTEKYIFDPASHYLGNGTHKIVLVFRSQPSTEEEDNVGLPDIYENSYINNVSISNIDWFEHKFVNATEIIDTFERKYYVSHGGCGDEAPQGGADKDGLLGYISGETSTVWQRDHREGILDVNNQGVFGTSGELTYMNKCRGRFVFDSIKEYTPVLGTIWEKERMQTNMHNLAMSKSKDSCTFKNIKLPFLEDTYLPENYIYRQTPNTFGSLVNTVVLRLTELIPQDKYSPGGHLYVPLWAHPTYCGNETFYYGYVAVTADSSADLTRYSPDTNSMTQVMAGPFTLKGLGTIAVDPRAHEDATGLLRNYLFNINEVTRYASGQYYLDLRLQMMSYLIHSVYPKYFNRNTGSRMFDSEITDLILGPNFRSFRYFPNTTKGWFDGWDRDLVRFNLYGGVRGRYFGPEFGGSDSTDEGDLVFNSDDYIGGNIPWF